MIKSQRTPTTPCRKTPGHEPRTLKSVVLAYEAVRTCLPDWPLLRPETSASLLSVLQDFPSGAQAVLWLNETRMYLDGQNGEEAAAALRYLLTTRSRIFVIGSMWSEDWHLLTRRPSHSGYQRQELAQELAGLDHPQAGELLLQSVVKIEVPRSFADEALNAVKQAARSDPRLDEAFNAASANGQIAQLLAGGPWLVEFYEHEASPYAKAILDAAIDARRLGHRSPLSADLLAVTAGSYLDERQRVAPAQWFGDALTEATTQIRDAVSPLAAIRLSRGVGAAEGYLVSDYLFEYAVKRRGHLSPPTQLWDALAVAVGTGDDHRSLGVAAERRFYWRHAVFHLRQVKGIDADAGLRLAKLLIRVGRPDEAAAVLQPLITDKTTEWHLVRGKNWDLIWTASRALEQAGRIEEAVALWQKRMPKSYKLIVDMAIAVLRDPETTVVEAADYWNRFRMGGLSFGGKDDIDLLEAGIWIWRRAGQTDRMLAEWRKAARSNVTAMTRVAFLLEEIGRVEDALAAWRRLAKRDDYGTAMLTRLLLRQGRVEDALAVWQPAAQSGDLTALREQAALLMRAGRIHDAITTCKVAADQGDIRASSMLAGLLEDAGRKDEAIAVWQNLAVGGNTYEMEALAGALQRAGELNEAVSAWRHLAASGNTHAVRSLAVALEQAGQITEAIGLRRQLAAADGIPEMRALADTLLRAGRRNEALAVWQPSAERGNTRAMRETARVLAEAGQSDAAERLLRDTAQHGDIEAFGQLLRLVKTTGRAEEAVQTAKFGLEPGGSTAAPWE